MNNIMYHVQYYGSCLTLCTIHSIMYYTCIVLCTMHSVILRTVRTKGVISARVESGFARFAHSTTMIHNNMHGT